MDLDIDNTGDLADIGNLLNSYKNGNALITNSPYSVPYTYDYYI